MKKKTLSLLLALVLCLGLLPTTALAADVKLAVKGKETVRYNDGEGHEWSVEDSDIVDLERNGSSCTVIGKKPGVTVLWVHYKIKIPRPAMVDGKYTTEYDTVTENARWSIMVYDPSEVTSPGPSKPAELPKPSKSYGTVGDDVSGIITDILPFNCGVVPVKYNGRWGLANAELKLLVPFQFEEMEEVTNDGYLHVEMDGKDYIIDTAGEAVYAHVPTSSKDVISCSDGYYTLVRVHETSSGDLKMPEYHTYDGEQITADEANALYYEWGNRLGDLCIMEKRGKDDNGSTLWLFCERSQYFKNNPEVLLRIPANGRDNEWWDLQEGLFGVRDRDTDLCGAVNMDGDLVIPCQYDYLAPSRDGYMSYQKGNKLGLLENPVNPPSGEVVKPTTPTEPTKPTTPTKPDTPTLPEVETIPASGTAYASTQTIRVDGIPVKFQTYALKNANGDPTNYVKLRDVAYVLSGTGAQFAVGWNGSGISLTTGKAYTVAGGEMETPFSGDRTYRDGTSSVNIDGRSVPLTAITLTDSSGGAYNYFKHRDLGQALGFDVSWSGETGISIKTK